MQSMVESSKGFTLIELIIVIAIVGILAAIAINSYRNYVIETKLTVIYGELNRYRLPYQMLMSGGAGVRDYTPDGLNMRATTQNCQFTVKEPVINGVTTEAVRCDIINFPLLAGENMSLDRDASGQWKCVHSASVPVRFLPDDCQ